MSEKNKTAEDFLFSGIGADDESLNVFDQKTANNDGIYRPNLKDAKDKKIGYRATLRFLPNILENGNLGPSAIEKHIHYVDMKNYPKLAGYYDCRKNYEPNCELCTEYWKLFNSKNAADNEKAETIKRSTKYYSYIMVIEDDQHPDLVGKVLIYPYGFTIKEKINSEKIGEVTGEKCNVFDLIDGKDFKLIIKEKGGFQNYDASSFMEKSPIKIYNETKKEFRPVPIETIQVDGKDQNIISTNPKVRTKLSEILTQKPVNLNDHKAIEWDTEMIGKVDKVLSVLSGNVEIDSETSIRESKKDGSKPTATATTESADEFFDIDDGEDF
jgi:hypothetical protein